MILNYRGYDVYYEVHGEGDALVFLNGIMMSTKSWAPFVEELSRHHQLILVDFLDQGQSARVDFAYDHDLQVDLLECLMDELALASAHLFGISYGGEIAIQFALKFPDRVKKLLLFNTTAWTSPWLREMGDGWNVNIHNPLGYYAATIPVIYSPLFYTKEIEWMNRRKEMLVNGPFADPVFMAGMERLTNSSAYYDKREEIKTINHPTLIVSCEYDFVTPRYEQDYLAKHIKTSHQIFIPDSGHASMYEKPDLFVSLVLGFIHERTVHYTI